MSDAPPTNRRGLPPGPRRRWAIGLALLASLLVAVGWPIGHRDMRVVVTLRSGPDAGIGQVFYGVGDEPLCEARSVVLTLKAGDWQQYVVDCPVARPAGLKLRLDPASRAQAEVDVQSVRVEFFHGPRVVVHEAAGDQLDGLTALEVVARAPGRLALRALTNDPQIDIPVNRLGTYWYPRSTVAIALLLFAALLVLIVDWPGVPDERMAAKHLIYAVAFGAMALQGFVYARKVPLGVPPDEWGHMSYIAHLKQDGRLTPDRANWRLYDAAGNAQPSPNHLAHPAFYYNLCARFAPDTPARIMRHVQALRDLNLLLALAGIGAFLWIVWREDLPLPLDVYFAAALASVPMLMLLAGSVNNDNLLLLAGALGVAGALDTLDAAPKRRGILLLALGTALAMLIKVTAGLHLGGFFALVLADRMRRDRSLAALRGVHVVAAAALLAMAAAVYAAFLLRYHTLTPTTGWTTFAAQALPATHLGPGRYLLHFLVRLSSTWTGFFTHASVLASSCAEAAPMLAPLLLAVVGCFWRDDPSRTSERTRLFFRVCRLAALATVALMAVHYVRCFQGYSRTGYMGGIQARYYFALMPCILALSARPFLHAWRRPLGFAMLALLTVGFMTAGIFRYALARF